MDMSYMVTIAPKLIAKLPLTFFVVGLASFLTLLLSFVLIAIQLANIPFWSRLVRVFISFSKSVPGLIHLFLIYYGLPILFPSLVADQSLTHKLVLSTIALIVYHSSYVSEVLLASYRAVPKGQLEAGLSIGLTYFQVQRRIILPQLLPTAFPSLGNALIDLLKDTSLLYLIGLIDIMGLAQILVSNSFGVHQLDVYLVVGLLFWGLSFLCQRLLDYIENRQKQERRIK